MSSPSITPFDKFIKSMEEQPPAGGRSLRVFGTLNCLTAPERVKEALYEHFRYIIVGGGTAGLVLARRLSEDPENSVLVLEAGGLETANPNIDIPSKAGSLAGTDLDWRYTTVQQEHLGGRRVAFPRGKLLGGCSTFNMQVWNRAPKCDYDAWWMLGNEGWDWASLLNYHRRSESFHPSSGNELDVSPRYKVRDHGHDGPVQVSYSQYISPQYGAVFDSLRELGVPEMSDPNGGKPYGAAWCPSSIDPETARRSSSETAYLEPISLRKNLLVITHAHVTKINWSKSLEDGLLVARGVSFAPHARSDVVWKAKATGEVLLCGGSLNSPQLLELSGIGSPRVLEPLGIKVAVDLPGVGEGLQDHPTIGITYKLKPGHVSLDLLSNPSFAAEVQAEYNSAQSGPLAQAAPFLAYLRPQEFMSEEDIAHGQRLMSVASPELPLKQQQRQIALYTESPMIEIVTINRNMGPPAEKDRAYLGVVVALQHSMARGSSHLNSADPFDKPTIDPRYLSHPSDAFHLAQGADFVRRLATTKALSAHIDEECKPGFKTIPADATEAEWQAWVATQIGTEHHPIGTCSMLPRADGGVVDHELVVYGTANVRVVDLSIAPLHLATHIQTAAYAIGEKAADMILS